MNKFWEFRAATATRPAELLLYGEISDVTWYGDEVTPQRFDEDLRALGDISELVVRINSPGGDVFAAEAIYTMLRRHPARIEVRIDGLAASAATLVAMAGDRIIMPANAMMMLHNPWRIIAGDAEELRQAADALDQIRESMLQIYQERSGLERERLIEILNAETWLTAAEAVELGFADEVEELVRIAAALRADSVLVNGLEIPRSRLSRLPVALLEGAGVNLESDAEPAEPGTESAEQEAAGDDEQAPAVGGDAAAAFRARERLLSLRSREEAIRDGNHC